MKKYPEPYLLELPKLGESGIGYISVAENNKAPLPFTIERVFWTYYTPEEVVRGRHAHKETEQILLAVSGTITLVAEDAHEHVQLFRLDKPNLGVYIPPCVWHTMQYSHNAVQLVFASHAYAADDYLRDKTAFRNYWLERLAAG